MRIIFFLFILLPFGLMAQTRSSCVSGLNIQLEDGRKEVFCSFEGKKVSLDCKNQGRKCALLQDWNIKKQKILAQFPLKKAYKQNPGSWICQQLGWKVLMGQMYDSSQVCVCQYSQGSSIICTSFIE